MVIQLSFYCANIDTNKRVIESALQAHPSWQQSAALGLVK